MSKSLLYLLSSVMSGLYSLCTVLKHTGVKRTEYNEAKGNSFRISDRSKYSCGWDEVNREIKSNQILRGLKWHIF